MSRISCSTIVRRCLRLMGRTITFLEARRFRSSTFWKNDISSARSFPQNFVSAEYYFEDIGNLMRIKHDGKQARREASTTESKHDGKPQNWTKTLI
ncbi:hypothetical protein YC2023_033298 [Brassica napus]